MASKAPKIGRKYATWSVLVVVLAMPILGCARHRDRIVVGSKNFTEQLVLGEMFAQIIESRAHLEVERRFYLAGTYDQKSWPDELISTPNTRARPSPPFSRNRRAVTRRKFTAE